MSVANQHSEECKVPPESPARVRLTADFVNSLVTTLQSASTSASLSSARTGGLLFGTVEEYSITVQAFRNFEFWDSRQNNSPSTDAKLGGLELIGWCSARHGDRGLLPREVQFHNRHFPRATDVILILDAERKQGSSIELFARTSNAPLSTQHFRQGSIRLPLHGPVTQPINVGLEEKNRHDDLTVSEPAVPDISTGPAETIVLLPPAPEPKTNKLPWLVSAALFVLATGMTFAWAHARGQYLALARNSQSVIGRIASSSGVRMRAESTGDGVLLSWNHNASPVRASKQGILHISDGSAQHTIYLDPGDLANGSIVYRPESSDAKFRLELVGDHGLVLSNDGPETAVDVAGVVDGPTPTNQETHEVTPTQTATASLQDETLPSYIPARALKQVLPDTQLFAVSDIRDGAEVDVQVRIDEKGAVIEAHVRNGTMDNGPLRSAALEAAKRWVFEPAKIGGKNIPSDHTIAFQFHS